MTNRKRGIVNSNSTFNWRDPSMPVIRSYKMADGTTRELVDPDYERRYRKHLMTAAVQPKYQDDPTYELKRNAKTKR